MGERLDRPPQGLGDPCLQLAEPPRMELVEQPHRCPRVGAFRSRPIVDPSTRRGKLLHEHRKWPVWPIQVHPARHRVEQARRECAVVGNAEPEAVGRTSGPVEPARTPVVTVAPKRDLVEYPTRIRLDQAGLQTLGLPRQDPEMGAVCVLPCTGTHRSSGSAGSKPEHSERWQIDRKAEGLAVPGLGNRLGDPGLRDACATPVARIVGVEDHLPALLR